VCSISAISPRVAPELSTILPITLFQAGTGLRQRHETLCRSLGSSCSIRSDGGELSHPAQHRCRSQPDRLTLGPQGRRMILFGSDDVRRRISARHGRIYMDRAMPEHIARPGGRSGAQPLARALRTCAQRSVALPAFVAHGGGVVLQPASQKRPDSERHTANSVRALSLVCVMPSLVACLYSGMVLLRRPTPHCTSRPALVSRAHLTPRPGVECNARHGCANRLFL